MTVASASRMIWAGFPAPVKAICMLWAMLLTVATTVAVPTTPASLINGTSTLPVPPVVVAAMVFALSVEKRPLSVMKLTVTPSGAGLPVKVTSSAVMMVEDVPLATRASDSADNLMPTIVPGEGGIGLGGSNSTSMLWVTAPALATI